MYCDAPTKSIKEMERRLRFGLVMDTNKSTTDRNLKGVIGRVGRRCKTAYVKYDYEAAYEHQADMEDERIIEKLWEGCGRCSRKTAYATKEIRAGEQLEVEIYPEFTKRQAGEIPEEGRKEKQRQAQRNLNEKNSRKMCERTINANFGDRDIWATFTYTDEEMPETMEQAEKDMTNYIRRLNYQRKKQGMKNARYVYVTECSEKGRFHHHIVLDGDMSMDMVEETWKKGRRNQVRRLKKDENGLTGMANYITKDKKGKSQKKWRASKGLKKPDERVNHYKFRKKDVDEVIRNHNCLEGKLLKWYGKEGYIFTSQEIRYNDFNGRYYIYARMRRITERSGERCSRRKRD